MSRTPPYVDQYTLQDCLGKNGMVETWKALDIQTQRQVIIKIYKRNSLEPSQFLLAAQAIASLQHPNIVHIDAIQTSRYLAAEGAFDYMVMEYIEGPTLAEHIAYTSGMKRFPPAAEILYLFSVIASAVDYAHQQGVCHRNIKPSNILLNKKRIARYELGEPMLTDFNISGLSNTSSTADNALPGTALYLSPEQVKGYIGNELSDIYALGVILYEVCTGVPPFQGEHPYAIMSQHINALPPSPVLLNPMIPPALAEVILHSIAKDPASRYSNALSMANALADAFNLPLPENLIVPDHITDQMSEPTIYKQLQTPILPYLDSSSSAVPVMQSSSPFLPVATPSQSVTPLSITPGTSIAPGDGISGAVVAQSVSSLPTRAATPVTSSVSLSPLQLPSMPPPTVPKSRRKGLIVALIAIVILVLAGSGLGAFLLLNHTTTTIVTTPIAGFAYFVSSGQVEENSSAGVNDELLIELQNVPNPTPGKSYYAWLLNDKIQLDTTAILLGKLTVKNGKVHFLYPGDAQHTNLLASSSRFLVTQEDANVLPANPTPDRSAWIYYSELPQKANPTDPNQLSMLDHLRYLLSDDPTLKGLGLRGGLDIWLFRNTEKILEWSGSARDYYHNAGAIKLMRYQFVRILDYLDGVSAVQADVPSGLPSVLASATQGSIGLLGQSSFLQLIGGHLSGIVQSPGITSNRSQLAYQINMAINNVRNWLEQVYQDVKQLINMTDQQLLQASSLTTLDDMVNYALFAYVGRLDPSTGQIQDGVVQIHDSIQRLATFEITVYTQGA